MANQSKLNGDGKVQLTGSAGRKPTPLQFGCQIAHCRQSQFPATAAQAEHEPCVEIAERGWQREPFCSAQRCLRLSGLERHPFYELGHGAAQPFSNSSLRFKTVHPLVSSILLLPSCFRSITFPSPYPVLQATRSRRSTIEQISHNDISFTHPSNHHFWHVALKQNSCSPCRVQHRERQRLLLHSHP